MVVYEHLEGGIVRTHSNAGVKIHGGFPEGDYNVVYDPEEAERTYVETNIPVDVEPPAPGTPRTFSKLKLKMALARAGLLQQFLTVLQGVELIEGSGYMASDAFADAVNLSESNDGFKAAVKAAKDALGVTDEQIEAILEASVADG